MPKKTEQVNFRLPKEDVEVLEEIEGKHGIPVAGLMRALAAEVISFYKKEGWYALPVVVTPKRPGAGLETEKSPQLSPSQGG